MFMRGSDTDRTVFRQPMPGGDRTSMRSTPGVRSPAIRDGIINPSGTISSDNLSKELSSFSNASFKATKGLNPIVNAANQLIAIFSKTRKTSKHSDIGGLHQRLLIELKEFEHSLRSLGLRQEQVLSAQYLMCSVLDEAVLNTPWGSESPWAQRTLLSVLHGETSGGERSFLILEKIRQSPDENIDLIELFYIFICIGFEGRYKFSNGGREALNNLRDEIFIIIRRNRGDYERSLSPSWKGLGNTKNQLRESVPLWFVAVLVSVILFFSYSGLRYWLYKNSAPVVQDLKTMSQDYNIDLYR